MRGAGSVDPQAGGGGRGVGQTALDTLTHSTGNEYTHTHRGTRSHWLTPTGILDSSLQSEKKVYLFFY